MSEIINGYEIVGEWHRANEGVWAKGEKGGKTYFVKKYDNVATQPDPAKIGTMFSEKAYEEHLRSFNQFKGRRDRINSSLRSISGDGGNIVLPLQSFIYEHCYTEVSNFYSDMLSEEEIIALPDHEKTTLLTTLTKILNGVHSLNIVHSDVKGTNVICTKNALNRYVLKLIDFGASYFTDDKPTDTNDYSGDQNYASPELGMVWLCEEAELDPAECINKLTTKSDIFSLGILYHTFLCGKRPSYAGIDLARVFGSREERLIYPFEVVLNGGHLEVSPEITNEKYREAIQKMIMTDPEERPSAKEVLSIITASSASSTTTSTVSGGHGPISTPHTPTPPTPPTPPSPPPVVSVNVDEPWESDRIAWVDNIKDLLREQNYKELSKTKNFLGQNAYCLISSSGQKTSASKTALISKGFATSLDGATSGGGASGDFGDTDDVLRAEDKELYTVNTEVLRSKNIKIRAAEKFNNATRKNSMGYEIYEVNTGTKYFRSTHLMPTGFLLRK